MSEIPTVDISDMKQKGRRGDYPSLDKLAEEKLNTNKGIYLDWMKENFGISEQSLRNYVSKGKADFTIQVLTHKESGRKAIFFFSK